MSDVFCPRCARPVTRLQRSGPRRSAAGSGPVIAYPCTCWLTAPQAAAVVADAAAILAVADAAKAVA